MQNLQKDNAIFNLMLKNGQQMQGEPTQANQTAPSPTEVLGNNAGANLNGPGEFLRIGPKVNYEEA